MKGCPFGFPLNSPQKDPPPQLAHVSLRRSSIDGFGAPLASALFLGVQSWMGHLKPKGDAPRENGLNTGAHEWTTQSHNLQLPGPRKWGETPMWAWLKTKRSGGQTAGSGPCFHLPGFHFATGFLSHSHVVSLEIQCSQQESRDFTCDLCERCRESELE